MLVEKNIKILLKLNQMTFEMSYKIVTMLAERIRIGANSNQLSNFRPKKHMRNLMCDIVDRNEKMEK